MAVIVAALFACLLYVGHRQRERQAALAELDSLDVALIAYSSCPNWLEKLGARRWWDRCFSWGSCGLQFAWGTSGYLERLCYTESEVARLIEICKHIEPDYIIVPAFAMSEANRENLERELPQVELIVD